MDDVAGVALAKPGPQRAGLYGALRRFSSPYTVTLIASTAPVIAGQITGVRLWRRRCHALVEAGLAAPTPAA